MAPKRIAMIMVYVAGAAEENYPALENDNHPLRGVLMARVFVFFLGDKMATRSFPGKSWARCSGSTRGEFQILWEQQALRSKVARFLR